MKWLNFFQKFVQILFIGMVKFYKKAISPWLPIACRYQPTCSEYARQAIEIHGCFKGTYLTLKRLLKCHPWGKSGYDPVPPKE